jgi:hypothetical protein
MLAVRNKASDSSLLRVTQLYRFTPAPRLIGVHAAVGCIIASDLHVSTALQSCN